MEKGRVTTLKDAQLIQHLWQEQINPEEELNPLSRFNRMMDEVHEAEEASQDLNGSRSSKERLGSEIGDIIFVAIGVLSTLGISVEDEINRILATNYEKYNPVVNRELREGGMNPTDAIVHQKRNYVKKQSF